MKTHFQDEDELKWMIVEVMEIIPINSKEQKEIANKNKKKLS